MAPPLNVGVVGYGYASKTFHAPLVATTPGLRLAAVVTRDPAKLHADWPAVEAVADPQALFARPDLDLVVIATANDSHFPLAEAALQAGKPVVVDKPFTLTAAEARALDALATASGRLLSVFHNRRWDADFLTLRRVLANGTLGRVVHFASHFDRFRPHVRDRWRERGGPGSGLWYDLGPHLLDQALQLFGRPEAIHLDTARQRDGATSDDYFHAFLRYGPLRAHLHASMLTAQPGPRFVVHGTAASLLKRGLDPQEDALRAGRFPHLGPAADWGIDLEPFELTAAFPAAADLSSSASELATRPLPTLAGNYPAYYAALRDALLGRGANPVPAAEATSVMELLELGLRSAAERRELPLDA